MQLDRYRPMPPAWSMRVTSLPQPAPTALGWLREYWRRARSRRRIAQLDGIALRDMGVSWAEAETEANKAWWRR